MSQNMHFATKYILKNAVPYVIINMVVILKMSYKDAPQVLKSYLTYLDVVNGRSSKTVYEYYLDLSNFFRYVKKERNKLSCELSDVDISNIDIDFIKQITLQDAYAFLQYIKEKGGNNRTVNRKTCSIRGFFKYYKNKVREIEVNPVENLECNTLPRTLPKFLSLNECQTLLSSINGENSKRDYAAIILFLNCGLRLSELVSINLSDVDNEFLTITGKGSKQRSLYLNKSCKDAIEDYITNERPFNNLTDDARKALFVSRKGNRMTPRAVQHMVEKRFNEAGLGDKNYSVHKLRHTAATLMHKHGGVDLRVLQEILGHENLGTTQIYTHVDSDQVKQAVESNPINKIKKESI